MADKPKRVSEMTVEERKAFQKNIRKPKDVKINRITVSSPGGDPTNRNKETSGRSIQTT